MLMNKNEYLLVVFASIYIYHTASESKSKFNLGSSSSELYRYTRYEGGLC